MEASRPSDQHHFGIPEITEDTFHVVLEELVRVHPDSGSTVTDHLDRKVDQIARENPELYKLLVVASNRLQDENPGIDRQAGLRIGAVMYEAFGMQEIIEQIKIMNIFGDDGPNEALIA